MSRPGGSAGGDHLDPLTHVIQVEHPDAVALARAEAGRAVRDIGHALVGHDAPLHLIEQVADHLDTLSELLADGEPRARAQERPRGDWGPPPAEGEVITSYAERPVSGQASPWGLDPAVWREGDEVVAGVTLRAAHEGAPGRSHGGIVAALFDDILGFVLNIHVIPAFTGELSVRYEAGTPIGRPLECRARLDGRDGRKLFMSGELSDVESGRIVARSTAVFISIPPDGFAAGATD